MDEKIVQNMRAALTKMMREYFDNAKDDKRCEMLNELIYKIYVDRNIVFSDVRYGYQRVYYKKEDFLTTDGMQYLLELYNNGTIKHFHLMTDKKFIILSISLYKI